MTDLREAARDCEVSDLMEQIDQLKKHQAETPLCNKHKPTGGVRGACLICALQELSAALSRIDYLCGEPNEYEMSGYDFHCDPSQVVKQVENLTKGKT